MGSAFSTFARGKVDHTGTYADDIIFRQQGHDLP